MTNKLRAYIDQARHVGCFKSPLTQSETSFKAFMKAKTVINPEDFYLNNSQALLSLIVAASAAEKQLLKHLPNSKELLPRLDDQTLETFYKAAHDQLLGAQISFDAIHLNHILRLYLAHNYLTHAVEYVGLEKSALILSLKDRSDASDKVRYLKYDALVLLALGKFELAREKINSAIQLREDRDFYPNRFFLFSRMTGTAALSRLREIKMLITIMQKKYKQNNVNRMRG